MTAGAAAALLPLAAAIGLWVAWSDMKFMKIPNTAVLALALVWLLPGLAVVALTGVSLAAWAWGWALAALVLVIGFLANLARLIGAGDAKFAAAMAPFFVGADLRLVAILFAACMLAAVVTHRAMRHLRPVRAASADWASWTDKDFPMGLALAGTLVFHLLLTILHAS